MPTGDGGSSTAEDPGSELSVRRAVDELAPADASEAQRRLYTSIVATVSQLASDRADTGDLKIVDAALAEMRAAFSMFRPYRGERKVTIFGSARTDPGDPAYRSTVDLAVTLAAHGWMVVTGAGPGIMAAGMEGAGRDRSIGVNIRLPHEQGANPFIAQDPKLVQMRYFFTRKLMLIKESDGYVVLPGGFGTLDESFEVLTLLQTGKAAPAPVVLLDTPGSGYWDGWRRFVDGEVASRGLISPGDEALYRKTDDVATAAGELLGFYRNYHSSRWVGDLLVLRMQHAPDRAELADLNRRFAGLLAGGAIRASSALPPERRDGDQVGLARLALRFDRVHYGLLRRLIDALNDLETPRRPAGDPGRSPGGRSPVGR